MLLRITDLPCIPIRFMDTPDATHALSHLLRTIGEHDHIQLVSGLVTSINVTMEACSRLWQVPTVEEDWRLLDRHEADEALRMQLSRLKGLSTRVSYLSELLIGLPWSHARPTAAILQALGVSSGLPLIANLGLLHRSCFHQHAATKTSSPPRSPISTSPSALIGTEDPSVALSASLEAESSESGTRFMARRMHAVLAKFFKGERFSMPHEC